MYMHITRKENQPVFNIYIACQFTVKLTLRKIDVENITLK